MAHQIDLWALIKGKIGIILLGSVFVAALSFAFLMVSQKKYKVETSYLIVQNQSASQDFYTLSKSAEYLGKILSEAVYSELFIDEVVKTQKVRTEFLPFERSEKLRYWSKLVMVSRNAEVGIFTVDVYSDNQKDALNISQAIADVLTTKNSLFRGDNQNVEVKVLSGPIWRSNPSFSNTVLSVIGGFILGLFLMIMKIYYKQVKDFSRWE